MDNSYFISANISRRNLLRRGMHVAVGLGALGLPSMGSAMMMQKRSLAFYHTHTNEELLVTYALGMQYDPEALEQINTYLGDFRTGETHPIDPRLLDILWVIQKKTGQQGVYSVISGYRSPGTNELLRENSSGVAKQSLHMQGKAIDVRFSELATSQVRQCALELEAGGVGYYPQSDFVHLDTGPYRTW